MSPLYFAGTITFLVSDNNTLPLFRPVPEFPVGLATSIGLESDSVSVVTEFPLDVLPSLALMLSTGLP